MNYSKHIDEEMLELYAMNRTVEPQLAQVEEHLLVCTFCQDALDSVEREISRIRDAFPTH